jgi:hypothetical protein
VAINISQEIIDYFKLRVRDLEATINLKLSVYRTTHEGYTDMKVYEPVFLQDENSLKILLQYSGVATWIEEYGSGSEMDKNSPYYSAYEAVMRPERKANNNAFTGHAKGEIYFGPDGKPHVSKSNRLAGKNLENPPGKMQPYIPEKAQHIISNEINAWCQQIHNELRRKIPELVIIKIKEGVRQ